MNEKKKALIKASTKLFLEKGYNNTSIQDILDESKISKGTFYHYFSSKKDVVAVIYEVYAEQFREERDLILVGQDKTDIDVFCKQLAVFFEMRSKSKNLHRLYAEVANDSEIDLKTLVCNYKLGMVQWIEKRLVDIFGEERREYLFDNALFIHAQMFHVVQFNVENPELDLSNEEIIRHIIARIPYMIEVSEKIGEKLIDYRVFECEFNQIQLGSEDLKEKITSAVNFLMKKAEKLDDTDISESLEFVVAELTKNEQPRLSIVENIIQGIKYDSSLKDEVEVIELQNYLQQLRSLKK